MGLKSAIHLDGTLNVPGDTDRGWSVELAVPWTALGELARRKSPPADGDQWRVNFSRVEWPLSRDRRRVSARQGEARAQLGLVAAACRRHAQAGDVGLRAVLVRPGRGRRRSSRTRRCRRGDGCTRCTTRSANSGRRTAAGPGPLPSSGRAPAVAGDLSAPAMATAGSLFEASVDLRLPDGRTQRWHIRQDSLIWPAE